MGGGASGEVKEKRWRNAVGGSRLGTKMYSKGGTGHEMSCDERLVTRVMMCVNIQIDRCCGVGQVTDRGFSRWAERATVQIAIDDLNAAILHPTRGHHSRGWVLNPQNNPDAISWAVETVEMLQQMVDPAVMPSKGSQRGSLGTRRGSKSDPKCISELTKDTYVKDLQVGDEILRSLYLYSRSERERRQVVKRLGTIISSGVTTRFQVRGERNGKGTGRE